MEVSPFTYVYLILMISSALSACLAAIKRDEEKFAAFVLTTWLTLIGFYSNLHAIYFPP